MTYVVSLASTTRVRAAHLLECMEEENSVALGICCLNLLDKTWKERVRCANSHISCMSAASPLTRTG
jgi:hypothetical protein